MFEIELPIPVPGVPSGQGNESNTMSVGDRSSTTDETIFSPVYLKYHGVIIVFAPSTDKLKSDPTAALDSAPVVAKIAVSVDPSSKLRVRSALSIPEPLIVCHPIKSLIR